MLNLAYKKTNQKKMLRKSPSDESTDNQKPNKWKKKNLSLLIFLVLALLILMRIMGMKHHEEEISYSEFKQMMAGDEQQFEKLTLRRNNEGYSLSASRTVDPTESESSQGKKDTFAPITKTIKVQLPFSDEVHNQIEEWDKKNIEIEFEKETAWMGWIGSFLPLILIIAFVWFMMSRQTQAGGGPRGIFSFGKSNAKLSNNEKPEVTFVDVAGCDEAKQDLQEIKEFLQAPEKFSKLGGKIPRGVLLLGPPGTGKTLLAKAVAGEADVPFFSMSGSDFVEMFVGVGASRVRDLFEQGKKNSPCIIFIDEIDAVGRHRGAGVGGGHDEREQTLNQLLVEMDGFNQNDGVILLAATNRPDVLDPALLRPGRFDRQIVVDAPDAKGRAGILEVHLNKREIPLGEDVDVSKIAKATPGLVGADLENLVNEACLMAARFGSKTVTMIDFEEAKDKIMIGTERVSRILSEEEKKTTAYHEAGHALITTKMEHADPLHKITIIPRGRALGITFSLPEKDQYTMSAEYITDKIAILLGGREAELLLFNQKNTGASNDIQVATDLARKYVCEWGMSDKLGPLSYGKKQEEVFLGKEIAQHRDYSESTAVMIDKEVNEIIMTQSLRVKELLKKHKQELINLAEALIEHENLEGEQITTAMTGEKVDAPIKSRSFIRFKNMDSKKIAAKESGKGPDATDSKSVDTKVAKVTEPDLSKKDDDKEDDSNRGINVDTSA